MSNNEMYEAALKPPRTKIQRALYTTWIVLGLSTLIGLAWAEPFSAKLFSMMIAAGVSPLLIKFVAMPLVMTLRAVLAVESVGYTYHRFFQHVGFFTRTAQVFRKNQKFHWIHHMIIYPIGRVYRRRVAYVPSEKHAWSWVIPGVIVAFLFVLSNGFNLSSAVFIVAMWGWAQLIVNKTHELFHEINHAFSNNAYFQWLEQIHVLHHWDQRTNYTIVHPLMDQLFGTYLSPAKHKAELQISLDDYDLTVSDLINWRYLLIEATPAERAAFVSSAKRHPRSVRKVGLLINLLEERIATHPQDAHAQDLRNKAEALLCAIGKDPAKVKAAV
jgi:hypothetical protein